MSYLSLCSQKAFSLIELFISIAFASVLASLSLGLFYQYQDKTRLAEMDLTYHDLRTSSFLVMQSISMDIPNASCMWQYSPALGPQDIACDTSTGENILSSIMNLKNSRLVVLTTFDVVGDSSDWIHTTTIFHCDIASGVNNINYINSSTGLYLNARSFENPATYAASCS